MAKQKKLTAAELDAALNQIAAEQKAWSAAQDRKREKEAKALEHREVALLALICQVGDFLDCQRRKRNSLHPCGIFPARSGTGIRKHASQIL